MNSTYEMSRGSCNFEKYWDRSKTQTFEYFRASGGLYSTTGDYMRFVSMWMNRGVHADKRLLSEATVGAALTPFIDEGYGMHWRIDIPRIMNGLPAEFGHGGSDGTLAMAFPELDTVVLFFTQSRRSRARVRFMEALADVEPFSDLLPNDPRRLAFEEQWEEASEQTQEAPENPDKYVGTYSQYSQGDLQHEVVFQDNQLGYIFSSSSVATSIKQISDGVFIGRHPCYHMLFRITFDPVSDEKPKYRFEASDGGEVEFSRD
jgi:CubicO group peptidase (beta-lactamase class C family)